MSNAKLLSALSIAASFHQNQRRKGSRGAPYINHLIDVADILATTAKVKDIDLLIAAVLHDLLEDTSATIDDIEVFGSRGILLVQSVTDDKSLPKEERKRLQIEHMREAAAETKLIKLADHCSNIVSLPDDWSLERKNQFLDGSERVAIHCFGVSTALDREYRERLNIAQQSLLINEGFIAQS